MLAYLGNGSILPSPSLLLLDLIQNPSKNKANIPGLMLGLPLGEREKAKKKKKKICCTDPWLPPPVSMHSAPQASIQLVLTSINHNRVVKEKGEKRKRQFKESNSRIH